MFSTSTLKTTSNDDNIECFFRADTHTITRPEVLQLNALVSLAGQKFKLNDVWGRAYHDNHHTVSLIFSDKDINNLSQAHPIVAIFAAHNITQTLEQHHDYAHMRYVVFTFPANQCQTIMQGINLLEINQQTLNGLAEEGMKRKAFC